MKPSPGFMLISRCLAIVGIAALSYLAGAAVIFFGLTSSDFLERGFIGARAWGSRGSGPAVQEDSAYPIAYRTAGQVDDPAKTFDGFTLYACADEEGEGTEAILIDMHGAPVHRWRVAKSEVRLYQPALTKGARTVHNFKPCFYGFHLSGNGDLLVVSHGAPPVAGCGLMKLDIHSNLDWEYPGPVHHNIDVAGDGTIYAIQAALLSDVPEGLKHIATPCQTDVLVTLSADGTPLREPISILEAFQASPYAVLLSPLSSRRELRLADLLHTNYVVILRPELAAGFPDFKPGQALISLRNLDTVAVLDIDTGSVIWAVRGPWRAQHDPHFLTNGHLLIFDNRGDEKGSRVLEYDLRTQAFPWSYPGANGQTFYSSERGMSQRLPNGNTLIVNSEGGEMMEVSRGHQLVWRFSTGRFITTARRYAPDELPFLAGKSSRP